MNNEEYLAIAEQVVDWVCQKNSPQKDCIVTLSLGLTAEGKIVRNAVLSVLMPVVEYSRDGNALMIYSRFPRETLLRLASKAVERMIVYEQIR